MIFTATKCPDCGAFISRNIRMDAGGLPIRVCPNCGTVHEDHQTAMPVYELKLMENYDREEAAG